MNITLENLKTNYDVYEAMCPYCGIESGICTASISLFKTSTDKGDVIRFRCPGYPECKTFK